MRAAFVATICASLVACASDGPRDAATNEDCHLIVDCWNYCSDGVVYTSVPVGMCEPRCVGTRMYVCPDGCGSPFSGRSAGAFDIYALCALPDAGPPDLGSDTGR